MNKPKIEGGYILLSRKIIESEIWDKPPLYIKVWLYLLSRAQHKEYKKLKRGQLWTSIAEIQEACGWYVGFRREKPTKDQVYNILEWMRTTSKADETRFPYESNYESNTNTTMITTTRATRGMVVNIVNYNVYQDSKNYESNDESNNEKVTRATREQRGGDTINKNDKECKNDKNDNKKHIGGDSSSASQTSNKKETVDGVIDEFTKADADLTEALKAFSEMRSKLKKPLTAYAMKLAISKLQKLSTRKDEQLEIINNSVVNSWQSFYELKKEVKQSGENQLNFTKEDGTFDKEKWAEYKRSQI